MTITTQKTLCDVTGKEVPTLRAQIGLSHQYDLSHEGAVRLLQGVSLRNSEARTHIIARCRPSDLPPEPPPPDAQIKVQMSLAEHDNLILAARKQAARECIEIMQSEVNRTASPNLYFVPERNITEHILKAFGL